MLKSWYSPEALMSCYMLCKHAKFEHLIRLHDRGIRLVALILSFNRGDIQIWKSLFSLSFKKAYSTWYITTHPHYSKIYTDFT